MIRRYNPNVVVIEDPSAKGSRRWSRVRLLLSRIQRLVVKEKVRIEFLPQPAEGSLYASQRIYPTPNRNDHCGKFSRACAKAASQTIVL